MEDNKDNIDLMGKDMILKKVYDGLKTGEKLLKIELCMKLPEDFKGDMNDALEEVIKYRRGEKNHDKVYEYNNELDLYSNWWEMVNTTNRPFIAKGSLSEYDGEKFNDVNW